MKIACWNINQRSGSRNAVIPNLVLEELLKRDLDIIVLTEYSDVQNHENFINKLMHAGYSVKKTRYEKNTNQILIAVKHTLVASDIEVHYFDNIETLPNLLHLKINNKLNIVGTRIKIGGYANQEEANQEFLDRRMQLERMIDYISGLENANEIILLGDLNNGKHNEFDEDKTYKGLPREHYNYYLIKDLLRDKGFKLHTPVESYSWKSSPKNQCKLDHIVTKKISDSEITNVKYDWDFTDRVDYKKEVGFPDHAILTATIKN
ncbi:MULTISPECIES: endonuclease/exonuclease/phosphatase family protein [unclassified Mammaliicoccus]|uniref:endonuclease/exonuclease/phosphatase family protein n=1 Tax=unclassified Mammaliicoccus TaxID=2803851 RepID=UPI001EFBE309|nr:MULTISPECIES: endonuclease/exonuclease/phosphatase family protein [unclassified Mammaliicoccus]